MDTSKEYIKMCEKAEEIQKYWRDSITGYFGIHCEGDWIVNCDGTPVVISIGEDWYKEPFTWLPRQDQLQEMMELPNELAIGLHYRLHCFLKDYTPTAFCNDNSMEQLWLAFVMKERYQKQWSGTDWISISI